MYNIFLKCIQQKNLAPAQKLSGYLIRPNQPSKQYNKTNNSTKQWKQHSSNSNLVCIYISMLPLYYYYYYIIIYVIKKYR